MHVGVVDVGALAVDDEVVAGRALEPVELHDPAAGGDERRSAGREHVLALVRVAVALAPKAACALAVGVAAAHGELVVDEVEGAGRERLRAPRRRPRHRRACRRGHGTRSGPAGCAAPPSLPSHGTLVTMPGASASGQVMDGRAVDHAHERDGDGHRRRARAGRAGRARRVVEDAAPDDPDIERGGHRRRAGRETIARLAGDRAPSALTARRRPLEALARARRRRRSCGAPCSTRTTTLSRCPCRRGTRSSRPRVIARPRMRSTLPVFAASMRGAAGDAGDGGDLRRLGGVRRRRSRRTRPQARQAQPRKPPRRRSASARPAPLCAAYGVS